MKRTTFIVLFLTLQFLADAQALLKGTIRNKQTKEALPGVIVYFPDLKAGTSTNENGQYQISRLPSVRAIVQIKLLGYKTMVKTIELQDSTVLDLQLEESVIEQEEIVVTGGNHATEAKKDPAPTISVDKRFLQLNSFSNIIEAISKVPGVNSLNTGPNVSKPVIRGLGYNRILTLFDGVRQEGQQWGDEHGIEIDQNLIDRIEVVKGPASLVYGSDALAGVVNLLPANPLPDGKRSGEFLTSYHTNNKQYLGSLNFAASDNGNTYSIRISKKKAGNYENRSDGKVYGTKYDESDVFMSGGINRSWGYSHLNFSYYDNIQEIPDGSRDSVTRKFTKQVTEDDTLRPIVSDKDLNSYTILSNHQRVQHIRVSSANSFYMANSRVVAKLGYQKSTRQEFAHPQFPTLPALNMHLHTGTYDLRFHFPERKGWDADLGMNGMLQQNENKTCTEYVIPDHRLLDVGPFAYIKKELGKWTLTAGTRYDNRTVIVDELYTVTDPGAIFSRRSNYVQGDTTLQKMFDAQHRNFHGVSGSVGMNYEVNDQLGLKFNVARAYRAPNISEISAQGIHPGSGLMQLGSKELKPEFSLQEDLGICFESEHFSAEMNLFNNFVENYIYNEKLSGSNGSDSIFNERGMDYPVFKYRQTKAQLYGGEFSFDLHPHPLDWLHFENGISVLYAQNLGTNEIKVTDSTRYLPTIPPLHTYSELKADVRKKVACFQDLFFKIGVQYYADQNRIYSAYDTETKTPGYTLLEAAIGASVVNARGKKLFQLMINGTNLTDEVYQSNMSRLKYFDNYPVNGTARSGIFNMGRNISFKLVIPLVAEK